MSLARAFTTRRMKQSVDIGDGKNGNIPQRSNTTARAGHTRVGSIRNKISAPQDLIHATNMLAYNAPDLHPRSASSKTSKASDDDSDSAHTSGSTPPTSPDVASVDDRSASPEQNHLSCYFTAPGQKPPADAPSIPKRAPSHTKKASYDNLAQKQLMSRSSTTSGRTVSSKSSFSSSRVSSATTASSVSLGSYSRPSSAKPPVPSVPVVSPQASVIPSTPAAPTKQMSQRRAEKPVAHPFGQELAQVSEIAEDFGIKDKLQATDQEEQWLISQGLCRFGADDYLSEVQDLFATFFKPSTPQHQPQPMWI